MKNTHNIWLKNLSPSIITKSKLPVLQVIFSFLIWGSAPSFWKRTSSYELLTILSYRVIWSFVLFFIVFRFLKNSTFQSLRKKELLSSLLSGMLIFINWGLYVYAVASDNILQASLGYYINPILNILIGVFFFSEKINFLGKIATIFSVFGVLLLGLGIGGIPWLSIGIAISFSLYGMVKKLDSGNPLKQITFEMGILSVLVILFLLPQVSDDKNLTLFNPLSIGTGLITALPLLMFSSGVKSVHLSTVGFLQYIAPTMNFLLAIFLYQEKFGVEEVFAFICIWIGILIFLYSKITESKKMRLNPRRHYGISN